MHLFWTQWQRLPASLDPIAFSFLGLPVSWYALFFLFGGTITYLFVRKEYIHKGLLTENEIRDFGFGAAVSALLGAKLGFLFFYWYPFLGSDFVFSILPRGAGITLPGMSFVGGLLGGILYVYWFSKKYRKEFFCLTDILALFIPITIFFGRLGNFLHGELPGRITNMPWGMYFPGQEVLRHPSTLYAAFVEGFLLFSILLVFNFFFFEKKKLVPGMMTVSFLILYGALRFFSEFFREPDVQIGYIGVFTLNQIFAACIVVIGLLLFSVQSAKK